MNTTNVYPKPDAPTEVETLFNNPEIVGIAAMLALAAGIIIAVKSRVIEAYRKP